MIGTFDLNEILHTIEAGLDDNAARRVSFIRGDEATVTGDRNLLEIVVQNLIQNALKYSTATSSVTVRLSKDQGFAFVNVVDQGIGVAPDDRELIFMKYYRAPGQQVNGSGLGLYISRGSPGSMAAMSRWRPAMLAGRYFASRCQSTSLVLNSIEK